METIFKAGARLYDLQRIKDEYFSYSYPLFGDDVLKYDIRYFKAFAQFEIVITRKYIKWELGDSKGTFNKSWLKYEVVDKDIVKRLIREDMLRKIANLGYSIDCNQIEMDELRNTLKTELFVK